eukprot:TRINITY_DN1040_c0_g7_i1.p1 TRINITY_DN1040_c0_g7~~TRINITY_DN1040_c0_g7_i1.p1  ORF type:complete len:2218 (+),score=543.13 TRINITY_DN1040_c0_g7_i1:82-6735(+)
MADTSLKTDVPPDCDDISPGVSITSNPVADQPASTTPTATTPTARDLSYTMKEDIAVEEPPMLYLKEQSGVVQKSDEPEETLEALQARNNENRAALIALLVASVLILMALSLWGIWYSEASSSAQITAKRSLEKMQAGLNKTTFDFAENATTLTSLTNANYKRGEVNYFGDVELSTSAQEAALDKAVTFLGGFVSSFPGVNNVYVGTATGRLLGAVRKADGEVVAFVKDPLKTNNSSGTTCLREYSYTLSRTTSLSSSVTVNWNSFVSGTSYEDCSYDPRTRDWYTTGSASSTRIWLPAAYIDSFGAGVASSTMLRILANSDGTTLRGVGAVDVTGSNLNFILDLYVSGGGVSFLLDQYGYLIGESTLKDSDTGVSTTLQTMILGVDYTATKAVSEAASAAYESTSYNWNSLTASRSVATLWEFYDDSYEAFVVTDEFGLRWLCFEVLAHRDIYDSLPEALIAGISISAAMLALLLAYIFVPMRDFFRRRFRERKTGHVFVEDPKDPVKDQFFETHAQRALKVQMVVMLGLALIWLAWTVSVSEAIQKSVKTVIDSSALFTISTTKNLVAKPASINHMLTWGQQIGESTITQYFTNAGSACSGVSCGDYLDPLFKMYIDAFPHVAYVFVGFQNTGDFIGCRKDSKNTSYTERTLGVADSTTSNTLWEYSFDTTTNKRTTTTVHKSTTSYDSRTRGWYSEGKAVYDAMISGDTTTYPTNATWTQPYNFFGSGRQTVGVTAVVPFWNTTTDAFLGVFGVDLVLTDVSTGLSDGGVDTGDSGAGRAWVVDGDADMIGTSTTDAISTNSVAYAFADATIQSVSVQIAGWFEYSWPAVSAAKFTQYTSDPVLHTSAVGEDVGLAWTQVVTATYDYFYSEAEYQIFLSFVIIALVFAIVSFMIKQLVDEMRDRRMWDVKSRLFDEFDDPQGNTEKVFEELEQLEKVRSKSGGGVRDAEADVQKKAGEIIHLTMRMIKTKMNAQFSRLNQRNREAVEYLTMAQDDSEGGGVLRMIMVDHFSTNKGPASTACNAKQLEVSETYANAATQAAIKGSRTLGFRVFSFMQNPVWKHSMTMLIVGFITFEYFDNDPTAIGLQIIILVILFFDAVMMWRFVWIERDTMMLKHSTSKVWNVAVVSLNGFFLILHSQGYSDPLRFTRPLMLVWRSLRVLRATRLFCTSIINAGNVFLVFFTTILVGTIFALILFHGLFDAYPMFNTFMTSAKHMFVLMATGENYADILPAALAVSEWYFVFFLIVTVVGMFFLTSLVIATFESQYQREMAEMKKIDRERRLAAMAPSFCLWTYNMTAARLDRLQTNTEEAQTETLENLTINKRSFQNLMSGYWSHKSQEKVLKKLCEVRQRSDLLRRELSRAKKHLTERRAHAQECAGTSCCPEEHGTGMKQLGVVVDEIDADGERLPELHVSEEEVDREVQGLKIDRLKIELAVKRMPLREPTREELQAMKEIMLEYSERVFKLLDVDESENVDFVEFEEIVMYLNLMPELHFNEVFFKEMQRRSLVELRRLKSENLSTPQTTLTLDNRARLKAEVKRLGDDIKRLDYEIEKAKIVAQDKFWGLTEISIDKFFTVYTFIHIIFLALYGTSVSSSFIDFIAVFLTVGHMMDVGMRILMMHRSRRWYVLSEYPQVQFKRRCNVAFVGTAGVGLLFYLLAHSGTISVSKEIEKMFQMLMAFSTLRILVLVDEFSKLLLSISSGIQPVRVYSILLCVIIYEFATMAYCSFRPGGWANIRAPEFDAQTYWDTPMWALITMYQLLVGEGWHEVMNWTELYTYKIVMLYFMIYTMIVSVLFAQLFVGIMIQMFQDTEEKRQQGGDMYVILGRLCQGKDMAGMNKVIYGLMTTRISLEDFEDEEYRPFIKQISSIQNAWRIRSNMKLFQNLQKEVHPVCALYNGKFAHDNEIKKYLSRVPVNMVFVKGEPFKTDSWIEQHELLSILFKRFKYFTQFTNIRLQNGQQVFELTSFLASQLRLIRGVADMAPIMLPQHILESTSKSNHMGVFSDIVHHGDLTIIVDKLKETGIDLSGKGNREFEDGTISTVEQDLYDAASESIDWKPKFDTSLSSYEEVLVKEGENERRSAALSRLYASVDNDTNVGEEEDAERDETWQQIVTYATQAAMQDWWDQDKLYGIKEEDPPPPKYRTYDALLDEDFPRELRTRINTAVILLDRLCRLVRLRALLSRTNFGIPWNFVDFAHWFVEAFFTPISKNWL